MWIWYAFIFSQVYLHSLIYARFRASFMRWFHFIITNESIVDTNLTLDSGAPFMCTRMCILLSECARTRVVPTIRVVAFATIMFWSKSSERKEKCFFFPKFRLNKNKKFLGDICTFEMSLIRFLSKPYDNYRYRTSKFVIKSIFIIHLPADITTNAFSLGA